MKRAGLSAYIVNALDPHKSIAIADHWKTVQWITGFTGWVCTLVLTETDAGFWTDGRYVIQARRELPENGISQYCTSDPDNESITDWLMNHLSEGAKVGLDGRIITKTDFDHLSEKLRRKKIQLVSDCDLVGEIWHNRPDVPTASIFELGLQYCGKTRKAKLSDVRRAMKDANADYYLLSALDNIAWLTNMRGADSPLYPIFHAYMLISNKNAVLFTNVEKLTTEIVGMLDSDGIIVRGLEDVVPYLEKLPNYGTIFYDPGYSSYALTSAIPSTIYKIEALDIVTKMKATKNDIELNNLRQANIQEAICVVRLIKFIKDNIGKHTLDEFQIGQWINTERLKFPEFIKPANVPIVGCLDHAVQLHYRPTKENRVVIPQEGFLLFDLCAHYLNGSTDITRTIALGAVTDKMRHDYTLVLKSQIQLATQKFIHGVTGPELDAVAKSIMWNEAINNPAGTGHGIGFCLYIQEGPCKIAIDQSPYFTAMMTTPIEPGMIFSNEPGIYKKGLYAIRLENTILAKEHLVNCYGRFLAFETISFIPYEPECIDTSMLTNSEKLWLDNYNQMVYDTISPYLNTDEVNWLKGKTIETVYNRR